MATKEGQGHVAIVGCSDQPRGLPSRVIIDCPWGMLQFPGTGKGCEKGMGVFHGRLEHIEETEAEHFHWF